MRIALLVLLGVAFLIALPCQAYPAIQGDDPGVVGSADSERSISPEVYTLALLIMGQADIYGPLCVTGRAHLNPPNEPVDAEHITCASAVMTGFTIIPSPIFTDPAHFPGATYYYVKGNKIGATWQAKIFDRNGVDITGGNTMTDVLIYNSATKTFTYNFDSSTKIAKYFDETTGIFKPNVGDTSVVVNFGEEPIVNPPGTLGVASLAFDGSYSSTIRATVINARYRGPLSPDSLRTVAGNWRGAVVDLKQITFEPRNGIAMIAYDMEKLGSSHTQLGTTALPTLAYVTHSVVSLASNFDLIGTIISLGDFHSTGGPTITYDSGYLCRLPDYFNPCPLPTGACCRPDCTCTIQTQAECEPEGVWYGLGSTCDPSPCDCPPSGACCWPDGGCSVVTEEYCSGSAGTYKGNGTSCSPDTCHVSSVSDGHRSPSPLRFLVIPNPSVRRIDFSCELPAATTVTLEIFTAGGALVRRIEEGTEPAGRHTVQWDGQDDSTHPLPSGVYLARITTREGSTTARVVVAR